MNIESALKYIHKTSWLGSKPGLSRTQKLLSFMDNPHKKLKFVHVAGTNGKGSTSACIAKILQKAGYKTGLYTSPYINVFNERMQINSEMISDGELCSLVEYIMPLCDKMQDDMPTEFELITCIAFEYFYRNGCDIVVLEVGMGGELDSTNVIDAPCVSVITAIDLDHTSFLGSTVEEVASAKAGIIKKGTRTVLYDCQKNVYDVFDKKCKDLGVMLVTPDFSKIKNIKYLEDKTVFDYGRYESLNLSLLGSYQPYNASVAIKAAELLRECGYNIPDSCIYEGLRDVFWCGRFEVLGKEPYFILDGAHNPHGMRAAVKSFNERFLGKKIHFVVGAMADKDVEGMMSMLVPLAERFYTVKPNNPRAMDKDELKGILEKLGAVAESYDDINQAVACAVKNAGPSGVCAGLGSLYFSADIRGAYERCMEPQ